MGIFCVHPSPSGFTFSPVFLPLSCPYLSDIAFPLSKDILDMHNDAHHAY